MDKPLKSQGFQWNHAQAIMDKFPFLVILSLSRAKANIDSMMRIGLAKPMYQALLNSPGYAKEAFEGALIPWCRVLTMFIKKQVSRKPKQKIIELDSNNLMGKKFMKAVREGRG